MNTRFCFILFGIAAIVVFVLVWLGRLLWRSRNETQLKSVATKIQYVGLIGAAVATLVGIVGAYYTFFTPFSPRVTVGAYSWRVRPEGSPNPPVEIAMWLSVKNMGVNPGEIIDLMAVLSLPKGDWLLSPMFFVDSEAYLKVINTPRDSPNLPTAEPFSPIFVAGRGHTSKAILFIPFIPRRTESGLSPEFIK